MDSKWPFFVAKNKYGSIPGKEEKQKIRKERRPEGNEKKESGNGHLEVILNVFFAIQKKRSILYE